MKKDYNFIRQYLPFLDINTQPIKDIGCDNTLGLPNKGIFGELNNITIDELDNFKLNNCHTTYDHKSPICQGCIIKEKCFLKYITHQEQLLNNLNINSKISKDGQTIKLQRSTCSIRTGQRSTGKTVSARGCTGSIRSGHKSYRTIHYPG